MLIHLVFFYAIFQVVHLPLLFFYFFRRKSY
nr:MAG TPA_asm: hypothetical protein [Caudoviricetes sp.]